MKKIKRLLVLILVICVTAAPLTACSEAEIATNNVKQDADNFKHTRRLTVINGITGDTLLVLTGRISITEVRDGRKQLEVLIHSWREELRDYNLPFAVVQIHDFYPRVTDEWKTVQAEQARIASKIPNTHLVVSRDICETTEIHPKNKSLLAKRAYTAIYEQSK